MKQLTRSRYFLAALAINQNEPEVALNLVPESNLFVTVRFIQFIAFTKSRTFDRACNILRRAIDSYKLNPAKSKPNFGNQMVGVFKMFPKKKAFICYILLLFV